jgi:acetoacetyl-CoA reductase
VYAGETATLRAAAFMGPIDVLVNNAGATVHGAVQDADMAKWRDILDVNFTAMAELTRQVLPGMIDRGRGAIINISSINGRHVSAGSAIYAATKHALNGFSGCLFEDVREHGVKVSTIMPGFVATDMTAALGKDGTRMIQPDDIAEAVVFVLSASPACCPTEIVIRPQRQP